MNLKEFARKKENVHLFFFIYREGWSVEERSSMTRQVLAKVALKLVSPQRRWRRSARRS